MVVAVYGGGVGWQVGYSQNLQAPQRSEGAVLDAGDVILVQLTAMKGTRGRVIVLFARDRIDKHELFQYTRDGGNYGNTVPIHRSPGP